MTDLLDEVTADLKEERYHYFTHKIVKIFAILAIATIIGTGIYIWKERSLEALQYRLSMWFNQAIVEAEQNQFDQAIAHFDQIIEHPHQEYAALAYLNKAAILVKQNKLDQAQTLLLEMSGQKQFDVAFRDLARINFLANQLNNKQPESTSTAELLKLVSKADRPWQLSGLQLKALYEIKENKISEAKKTLQQILSSKNASGESRDTASTMLAVISQAQ